MKKGLLFIASGLLIAHVASVSAASFVNHYGNVGTNGLVVDNKEKVEEFPANEKNCIKWEDVCVNKSHCTYRLPMREGGCFRCLKPSHYGVHLYPRMESRDTCNYDTAQYLRMMGYWCYVPYDVAPCERTVQTQECHMKCVAYRESEESVVY